MIRKAIERIKAWWRGEVPVEGAGRGRMYSRAKSKMTVKMKITRSDGTVEFKEIK